MQSQNISKSEELFCESQRFIPGGVNSPVRAFKSVGGTPRFMASAKGARLTDVDGNEYIDYIGSWGPMILGHAYPPVLEAIAEAARHSTSFGAPTARELALAELITQMVPGAEMVRFVSSGTEACMSAVRLARGATGRAKILKFAGCYHGHSDSFLIQAGSGAATLGTPSSPGVTVGTAQDTLLAPYNDLAATTALAEAHQADLAAIIVEPVAGNMGCIMPKAGFLEGLRALCNRTGALLIFDEVMTGFRLAAGGAQERLGVQADLITLGKIIGGGLPVGAYAGSRALMEHVAPVGKVYQAGTLSGNPLCMAAGLAQLGTLRAKPEVYSYLDAITAQLAHGLLAISNHLGIPAQVNQLGSMVSIHFTATPVIDFATAAGADMALFGKFFQGLLQRRVYWPPSAYESLFLSAAHTEEDIEITLKAAEAALKEAIR